MTGLQVVISASSTEELVVSSGGHGLGGRGVVIDRLCVRIIIRKKCLLYPPNRETFSNFFFHILLTVFPPEFQIKRGDSLIGEERRWKE